MDQMKISDFLENFDGETKRGNCKVCLRLVTWSKGRLASHKRSRCTASTPEVFFLPPPEPDEGPRKFNISEYLDNFEKISKRGICKVCQTPVLWSSERVASHKRQNCTEPVPEMFLKENLDKMSFSRLKRKAKVPFIDVSAYLENFSSELKRGSCKVCKKLITWSRARVASHKRSSCTEPTPEEFLSSSVAGSAVEGIMTHIKTGCNKVSKKLKPSTASSVDHLESKDFYDSSSLNTNPAPPVFKPAKLAQKCFICNEYSTIDRKQLTTVLSSSRTPLYKTLESFTGVELSLDTINYSEACQDCASSIEKYDNFVHLSTQIQKKIADKFHSTHSQQVFIKGEPEFEIVNVVENMDCSTSFQEITKLEPLKLVDDNDPPFKLENYSEETDGDNFQEPLPSTSLFECDKCDQKLVNRVSLADHLKTHVSSKTRWKCDKCSLNFQAEGSLEIHKILSHSENSPKQFTCPICDKAFECRETFRNHYHQHKSTKNFLCNRCGTVFKNKKYYNRHMMIHDDVRPFKCQFDGCQKSFRTATNLKLHNRVHTREKLYTCEFCPGKRFAQEWGRQLHMKNQHQTDVNKKENCKICGAAVHKGAKMKAHLVKAHQVFESVDQRRYQEYSETS